MGIVIKADKDEVNISEYVLNALGKEERNDICIRKLERGLEQVRDEFGVKKTMEELEGMAYKA